MNSLALGFRGLPLPSGRQPQRPTRPRGAHCENWFFRPRGGQPFTLKKSTNIKGLIRRRRSGNNERDVNTIWIFWFFGGASFHDFFASESACKPRKNNNTIQRAIIAKKYQRVVKYIILPTFWSLFGFLRRSLSAFWSVFEVFCSFTCPQEQMKLDVI